MLHVLASADATYGGPVAALTGLAEALNSRTEIHICSLHNETVASPLLKVLPADQLHFFPRHSPAARRFGVSLRLAVWLMRHVKEYDQVFIHGIFDFPALTAMHVCTARSVSWHLRPYGSLDPYDLHRRNPRVKALIGRLFLRRLIKRAESIWCTTLSEAERVHLYGASTPIRVAPLPVQQITLTRSERADARRALGLPEAAQVILFLSRLDLKKKVETLIEAIATERLASAHLLIAGTGTSQYKETLQGLALRLGVSDRLHWMGWVDAQAKTQALDASDIYVLNSDNENFGLSAAEAIAAGLPSVLSPGVFISQDVATVGAAIVTDGSFEDLCLQVSELLDSPSRMTKLEVAGKEYWQNNWSNKAVAFRFSEQFLS